MITFLQKQTTETPQRLTDTVCAFPCGLSASDGAGTLCNGQQEQILVTNQRRWPLQEYQWTVLEGLGCSITGRIGGGAMQDNDAPS